ncbi:MAG: Uma2 family endonuclease [Pleurocapsa minor GSE-CHR-MK-17-07R]|jgi:Uma2 family endonuclease|nr:Uma2 family endonuclease [Pleurocapsa minor GSE-CHR-MK 17-07R]
MVTGVNLVTVEQFEQFLARPENRERVFELIDGEIVEKVPTREHAAIAFNFAYEFGRFLDEHDIGQGAVEARHRPTDDPHNDRLPDVSIVLGNRPVERTGAANYMPDVCVEIQSPADSLIAMRDKAQFYLRHGTKLVILVYTQQRILEVVTPGNAYLLTEADTLEGGEILPGFSVPVSRLFRRL